MSSLKQQPPERKRRGRKPDPPELKRLLKYAASQGLFDSLMTRVEFRRNWWKIQRDPNWLDKLFTHD